MEPAERVRTICLRHADATERLSHGEPCWFVRGKRPFACFADHHHDKRTSVWISAPPAAQVALVASNPAKYFRPPYVGVRGWVGAFLDNDPDWVDIEALLEEGYAHVAKLQSTATH